jgi:hypothetical protein
MRILVAFALVVALGGLLAVSGTAHSHDDGVPADAGFRLRDGSAGCAYAAGRVACRTTGMREATVLGTDGSTSLGDVAVSWSSETTVLRPTESWWHGGFTCGVAGPRIVCRTLGGATIAVR